MDGLRQAQRRPRSTTNDRFVNLRSLALPRKARWYSPPATSTPSSSATSTAPWVRAYARAEWNVYWPHSSWESGRSMNWKMLSRALRGRAFAHPSSELKLRGWTLLEKLSFFLAKGRTVGRFYL